MENSFHCPAPYQSEYQEETYSQTVQQKKNLKKKLLEDNEINLDYLEFGNDFSDTIPKACSMRERTSKWDSVKFKFLLHMILLREWKVKSQTGGKTIKHISDLGLIAKMGKGPLKFNNNSNRSLKQQKIWKTPHQRRYTDVK